MIKRFKKERGLARWLWLVLVVIGCALTIPVIGLRNNGASAQTAGSTVALSSAHAVTAKQIKAREQYWLSKQGFTHGVPAGAFANAIDQASQMEATGTGRKLAASALATSFAWDFLGPDPISLVTDFDGLLFGPAHSGAGSFTALAVDSNPSDIASNPNDTSYIFAGSANGGVYLSADGGQTFSQVFNGQPTEAIGAIAIDTTTTPSTVYVGTGNPNGFFDSYYGAGVFSSTDLGNTWTQIMPAAFVQGNVSVSKIAIDTSANPHIIFVGATNGFSANRADASTVETGFEPSETGLWESTDGGSTWNQYPASALGNCYIDDPSNPCPVDDVELDPAVNSTGSHNLYVAVDGYFAVEGVNLATSGVGGVYESTNEGGTFSLFIPSGSRSSIAIGQPASSGVASAAYFMIGDVNGEAYTNFWYFDGTKLHKETVPQFSDSGITFDGVNPNNQTNSFYDQALTVLPGTSNTVFFGGVGLYKGVNSGTAVNWTSIINTSLGGAAAYQHALAYDASTSQMLLADDGGLYSFNPTLNSNVTFASLNGGNSSSNPSGAIDTTLVQGIGPHPTNNSLLLAGFQAAGTEEYQGSATSWYFPTSEAGDGGFVMFDPSDPTYAYHTYSNDNLDANVSFAFSSNASSTSPGPAWTSAAPSKSLTAALKSVSDTGAAYYPPIAVDPTAAHRVFFGAQGMYVSNNGGTTWVVQDPVDDFTSGCGDGSCAIQDIEPVSHTNGWALTMGTALLDYPFELWNTTTLNQDTSNGGSGGTWINVTANLPTGPGSSAINSDTQATGIAVDHNHPNTAYLSLSGFCGGSAGTGVGHIYKTTDFGNTWAEADGGCGQASPALPDVPVLRVLVDSADPTGNTLYAATDIGVFQSTDGGNTWASFNLGTLQAIPVFDIEENQNNTIFIGTHGKGVFELAETTSASTPTPTPTPSVTPTPIPSPTPSSEPTQVPGALTVSPVSITFPATAFGASGATSPPKLVTVTNPKKRNEPSIVVEQIVFGTSTNGTYTPLNDKCSGQTLAPGAKCQYQVLFTPSGAGKSTSTVGIKNNGTTAPLVKLAGTGVFGSLTASPKSLKFPATAVGTSASLSLLLENKTAAPIAIDTITPNGKDPGDYAVSADSCSGTTVASGSNCSVGVTFTPAAKGSRPATLTVAGTTKAPLNIALSGQGK